MEQLEAGVSPRDHPHRMDYSKTPTVVKGRESQKNWASITKLCFASEILD